MSKYAKVAQAAIADDRLHPSDIKVLCALGSYADSKTGLCNPSYADISKRFNIPRSTVTLSIRRLTQIGYIEKAHTCRANNSQGANTYRILTAKDWQGDMPSISTPLLTQISTPLLILLAGQWTENSPIEQPKKRKSLRRRLKSWRSKLLRLERPYRSLIVKLCRVQMALTNSGQCGSQRIANLQLHANRVLRPTFALYVQGPIQSKFWPARKSISRTMAGREMAENS